MTTYKWETIRYVVTSEPYPLFICTWILKFSSSSTRNFKLEYVKNQVQIGRRISTWPVTLGTLEHWTDFVEVNLLALRNARLLQFYQTNRTQFGFISFLSRVQWPMGDKVRNLGSERHLRQPHYFKTSFLANLLDYKQPEMLCLIFWPRQTSGMILVN